MTIKAKYRSLIIGLSAAIAVIITAWAIWLHVVPTTPQSTASDMSANKSRSNAPRAGGRRNAPMPPVQIAVATKQTLSRFLSGLGTATAANTVNITSRVSGQLMALHFTEGQQVKAGDLLAEIDPRPYQVQLTQALGQLAKNQALLANAKQDLARYQQLAKNNLVSRQELDNQHTLVRQTEGAIKADQGAVDSAKLQLTYSKVTAPIEGRVGLKLVDVGNDIATGNAMVVITQTHPMDVIFTLPESNITDLIKAQKAGPVTVEAWDRTRQQRLATGTLLSLDNQIDIATGTIKLKARFNNQDDALFPNQFVNARINVATLKDAVVIPSTALQMGDQGHFVWLLQQDNKVTKQSVTIGSEEDQQVVINTGLSAGQQVITDGIDRLNDGMQVDVLAPTDTHNANNNPARKG